MKKSFTVCLLIVVGHFANAQTQPNAASAVPAPLHIDTTIGLDFIGRLESRPLRLTKDDRVNVQVGAFVYLMNEERYNFCRSLTDADCENQYGILLSKFKESVADRDKLMVNLEGVQKQTIVESQKLIEIYKAQLDQMKNQVEGTQKQLENAQSNMKDAQVLLKEGRRQNFMDKFWVGAGCVGAGLILGLLLK